MIRRYFQKRKIPPKLPITLNFCKAKEIFYLCIELVKNMFPQIVSNIPVNLDFTVEDKTYLYEFLFSR